MRRLTRVAHTATASTLAVLALVSCGGEGSDPAATARPSVVVALYPLEEIARRVAGDIVDVSTLTPAGMDAHSVELTAKQLDVLHGADLVLYLGDDFQPVVQDAVEALPGAVRTVDMLTTVDLIDAGTGARPAHDPHVWLDPRNMVAMVQAVANAMSSLLDDGGAAAVVANADRYVDELVLLDREMEQGLRTCASRTLVTSHDAFGYLAARYDLATLSVTGLNPDEDPSARQLEDLAAAARRAGVRTVFFESLLPADLARTVARTIGADTDVLDPIEGISRAAAEAGATYLSIQRDNLARLRKGLACR